MRILILSQYFWPESFRVNDLVTALRARGHEVRVLTGMPNYPVGKFFEGYGLFRKWVDSFDGVRVDRVPLWPRGKGGALNLILNYGSFIASASIFGLARVFSRYDCVFVFAPSPILQCLPAILFKKLTGTPLALWVQDLWPESVSAVGVVKRGWILRRIEALVRFIYRHCDLILIQSEAFRPNVESLSEPGANIRYLPNWAEDLYRPLPVQKAEDLAQTLPKGFKVMFAGNLGVAQGLYTILEAAEKLKSVPDLHWVIIGDGRDRKSFQERINEKGLRDRFVFVGRKPMSEMPRYFALADGLLVTLKAEPIFASTIPSKLQSYFACGRPVIASINGEGARVVEDSGAGWAGPAEDADTLANNVMKLYETPAEERERIGRRGLDYYNHHFGRELLLGNLENWIDSLNNGPFGQGRMTDETT